MIKKMIEVAGALVPADKAKNVLICDRCGIVMVRDFESDAAYPLAGLHKLPTRYGQLGPNTNFGTNPEFFGVLCDDCEPLIRAVLRNPENDPIIRQAFGIKPEPKTENKEGSHENQ